MISIQIHGDRELIARLDALPEKMRKALAGKTRILAQALQDHVTEQKLSGQVLNIVTGKLTRSIDNRVEESGTAVKGFVFSSGDVKYAARHEFGFDGPEEVSAHTRTIKQAFGRALSEPKTIAIRAFARQAHTPERSFMRSSLADMRGEIVEGLTQAIKEATRQ